jgi:hypothetical protein
VRIPARAVGKRGYLEGRAVCINSRASQNIDGSSASVRPDACELDNPAPLLNLNCHIGGKLRRS